MPSTTRTQGLHERVCRKWPGHFRSRWGLGGEQEAQASRVAEESLAHGWCSEVLTRLKEPARTVWYPGTSWRLEELLPPQAWGKERGGQCGTVTGAGDFSKGWRPPWQVDEYSLDPSPLYPPIPVSASHWPGPTEARWQGDQAIESIEQDGEG